MYFKDKIKKDMNEILHGNLADTARKHFGRISDDWDDRKKENALADVYDKLQSKLDKTEDTDKIRLENELSRIRREDTDKLLKERKLYNPSMSNSDKQTTLGAVYDRIQKELESKEEVTLKRPWEISKPKMQERPETEKMPGKATPEKPVPMPYRPGDNYGEKRLSEIEKEIKEVMHGDTDEWLKKNGLFTSKMPENKREKLLGYMYDRLNEERDKIVKNNSLADKTKTKPERTSPVKTNTPQINQYSNKTKTEPEEMVSFALKPKDNSKLDIDSVNNAIRGSLSYKNLLPSDEQDFLSNNEGSIKNDEPVKTSYRNNDKVSEIESDIKDITSTSDLDYVIENYAEKYGVDYEVGMNDEYKEKVVNDIKNCAEHDLNKAITTRYGRENNPPYDTSILLSEDDVGYNKQKIQFVGGYYDEKGNWHYWDNWMRTGEFKYVEDPMQLYLNGEITEDDPEFKKAVSWWASNGDYRINDLGQFEEDDFGRKIGSDIQAQNYNRYDDYILAFTNYVNKHFGTAIDPNRIKAYMYTESRIGYDSGNNGSRDVMQTANDYDFAIHRLAAYNGHRQYDPNEGTKYIPRDGYGLFKKVGGNGYYYADAVTPAMSTLGGVLWYAVRDGDHNGGGNKLYYQDVSNALEKMK